MAIKSNKKNPMAKDLFTKKYKPKIVKPKKGEVYLRTECPRGELGYHLVADGTKLPYRVKVKSSCFTHVSMLPEMAPGQMIADFVASIGSIDIVLGEVDR